MVTQSTENSLRPAGPILFLDIYPDRLNVKLRAGSLPIADSPLNAHLKKRPLLDNDKWVSYPGLAYRQMASLLDDYRREDPTLQSFQESIVVMGTKNDPFFPYERKFDSALKILEQIARLSPKLLYIQTRSPLIVLTLPLLQALGQRALVSISLETISDRLAVEQLPKLPRPSERLKAARALRNLGVPTLLQVSPLTLERGLVRYATLLDSVAEFIVVREALAPRNGKSCRTGTDTATVLRSILARTAPDKLLDSVSEAWFEQISHREVGLQCEAA